MNASVEIVLIIPTFWVFYLHTWNHELSLRDYSCCFFSNAPNTAVKITQTHTLPLTHGPSHVHTYSAITLCPSLGHTHDMCALTHHLSHHPPRVIFSFLPPVNCQVQSVQGWQTFFLAWGRMRHIKCACPLHALGTEWRGNINVEISRTVFDLHGSFQVQFKVL